MGGKSIKKLRKLPHVFSKVLELPITSDADVEVEENPEFFRFVAEMEQHGENIGNVRAQVVEIHPGVTKMVVRNGGEEELEVDTWRFRLPPSAKPELATAVFADGRLIVMVPKGGGGRDVLVGRGNTKLPYIDTIFLKSLK